VRPRADGGIDWTQLLRDAQYHGMLPLLTRHLKRTNPHAVPRAVADCLFDYSRRTEAGSVRHIAELSRILRLFEKNGIPAFTYRGPALSATIYGSPSLREFNALNVVVPLHSVLAAKALLLQDGYVPDRTRSRSQELAQVHFDGVYRLDRPEDRMHVWLQTEVEPGAFCVPLNLTTLQHRLRTMSIELAAVTTLSPVDLLIALCAYLVRPEPPRLCALVDVANLVAAHPTLDWSDVVRQASHLGVARRVAAALLLAHDVLGALVPHDVLAGTDQARRVAEDVERRLFSDRATWPDVLGALRSHVNARDTLGDRLQMCRRLLFTPTEGDWNAVSLPERCWPFYRVVRPFRLAGAMAGLTGSRTLAPFMPAPLEAVEGMLSLARVGPDDVVYDIGSGDGRIVIMAAERFGARGVGIDIDAGRVVEARANARRAGVERLTQFIEGNAEKLDLSAATVITLYMGATANRALRPKLQHTLRQGTRIVSLTYDMGDWEPRRTELVPHDSGVAQVFLWQIGAGTRERSDAHHG
jgi:hypothetical protein